ncbi:MAG: hypothetical protein ACFE9Z_01295 [Promethearchaeota archaeon]
MFIIRIIGLGTSFEFFYDLKKNFYFYFILGWMFAIIGNLLALLIDLIDNTSLLETILVFNALFISLSMFLLMIGMLSYYLKINFRYLVLSCIGIIIIALMLFIFIDYTISINFSVLIMNLVIIIAFLIPFFKYKKFRKIIGKSIRWYYVGFVTLLGFLPISLFISSQGYGYGLYFTDDILFIILNYTIGIINHLLLIVLLIHLEFTISNRQQNQLKDKYSHNLGNIMQVIYSSADLFKRIIKTENIDNDKLDLIEKKCKEASKIIKEIRNL